MKCRMNRRVQFHKRHQVFIGARNETPWIVLLRVSNEDYRISVASGADRGSLRDQPNACSVWLRGFWFFAYSVQGGPGQPFPSFLSQFGRATQRELLFDAHLVRLNGFDTDIQFTCQFRNTDASANKRENLQLTITQTVNIEAARSFRASCEVA